VLISFSKFTDSRTHVHFEPYARVII